MGAHGPTVSARRTHDLAPYNRMPAFTTEGNCQNTGTTLMNDRYAAYSALKFDCPAERILRVTLDNDHVACTG